MQAIAYFVHGRGRGHGSRSKPVIAALREAGYRVVVFAGGDALFTLRGDPELRPTIPILPGPLATVQTLQALPGTRRRLRQLGPQLLITDGDGPSLLAAHSLGVPSIAIGHGLVFRYGQFEGVPRTSLLRESVNVASSSLGATRKIAVHFLGVQSRDARVRIARPDLADLPDPPHGPERPPVGAPRVLCYFRDGNGKGPVTLLLAQGANVSLFGQRLASSEAEPVTAGDPLRLEYPGPQRATFVERLVSSHAVVASAGSNLLSECVALSKPVLALYKRSDHEQRLNALLLERANLGVACTFDALRPEVVHSFLARVRSGAFSSYPLLTALPGVSQAVEESVRELLGSA
jgi:UDP-N-acetylglucosamine--N-acetylmuramyl-(pentapeptide) pyrophosphoryl-undecaprenol N-acetylglucosamine transferase